MTGAGPDAELSRFLESCPGDIRVRLGEWGIIDAVRAAAEKSIGEHVSGWRASMIAKGNSKSHIKESVAKIVRVCDDCKWRHPSDISAVAFDQWRTEQKESGMSAMTLNHYLTVSKTFCNWLKKERR